MATIDPGLERVVVAETRCSEVDGERGRLTIAGRPVDQWAGAESVEAQRRMVGRADVGGARVTVRAFLVLVAAVGLE